MAEQPVGRFLELLRESDNPRLRNAFSKTSASEERAFEIIDQLYSGEGDSFSLITELKSLFPDISDIGTPDEVGFRAEAFLEGRIAQRHDVEEDFQKFLESFGA